MPEEDKPAKKLTRGRSFPAISLAEAAKIVQKAGAYSRELSLGSLASYAGHTTANSGPFRTKVAALKDWGLISAPKDDSVTLTDRAMAIALPQDEQQAEEAMRDAFFGFDLFALVYKDSAKGIELSRVNMANSAVHTYKVAIQAKDKFVKSFVSSAISVGLAEPVGRDKVIIKPQGVVAEPTTTAEGEEAENAGAVLKTPVSTVSPSTNPVMQQVWDFEGGKVHLVIESSTPLGLEVFHELPKVIGAIQDLVEVLGPKVNNDGVSA